MTDPIDLLNEASWLDSEDAGESGEWLLVSLLRGHRTVGDLRRVLAMARDAERLRAALLVGHRVRPVRGLPGGDGGYCVLDGADWPCRAARAALEGTDR